MLLLLFLLLLLLLFDMRLGIDIVAIDMGVRRRWLIYNIRVLRQRG